MGGTHGPEARGAHERTTHERRKRPPLIAPPGRRGDVGVKYIHVARDGRDACLSFHNYGLAFTAQALDALDRAGLQDETIQHPLSTPSDPAEHFHRWLTQGVVPGHEDGSPTVSFFQFERSWWGERHRSNILLVHYNDLKADLSGEMQRVADYLDIHVSPEIWPQLVEAAEFEAMRRDADTLMGAGTAMFQDGGRTFFHKGTNERWRGVFREGELALHDAKVKAMFSPACARWVAQGRLKAGDPRSMID